MIMNSTGSSGCENNTASSGRKSNMSYSACDYGLVMVQRILICLSILLGYDLISFPREFPQLFLFRTLTRIIRNFFFITKAIRKWLAINYNNGVIPEPPVRGNRTGFRVVRSTPIDSCLSSHLEGSLKHSPIDRRYVEPAKNYDLATALKERHNHSQGNELRCFYAESHSSDFLRHSSLSFRFLLNGLAQSFMGNIEDPDEEMNRKEEADSQAKGKGVERAAQQQEIVMEKAEVSQEPVDISENRRRNEMVVESVLDHDAEQRQNTNTSSETDSREPLPVPNFDETASPSIPKTDD